MPEGKMAYMIRLNSKLLVAFHACVEVFRVTNNNTVEAHVGGKDVIVCHQDTQEKCIEFLNELETDCNGLNLAFEKIKKGEKVEREGMAIKDLLVMRLIP
jgi:hypothetical protein